MSDDLKAARGLNVMIVGVGGQGVLLISKVMATLGARQGLQVKQSEVHGMAKRGGAVFSHVRFAETVWSPTIVKGEADAILALEWAEGLRWLDHLRPGLGVFIADTKRIVPPFACRNRGAGAGMGYARETPEDVISRVADGFALDATAMAAEKGDARAANVVLLGAFSTALDIGVEDWLSTIESLVPPKTREINRAAFLAGRDWASAARADASLRYDGSVQRYRAPGESPDVEIALEIDAAWCKGCDICVKLCPERCLALDERHVAYLKRPTACTGCHVCEWLCPDFAISVKKTVKPQVAA